MDALALIFAAVLPWAAGGALLLAVHWPAPSAAAWRVAGRLAAVAGYGYFVGLFLLTAWMRLLSAIGIGFGRLTIAGPLLLLAAVAIYRARGARWSLPHLWAVVRSILQPPLPRWQRIVWLLLLAWLALRFATLAAEVAVRPLYPWDAWTQWATKARVWFELRRMAPFVPANVWLSGPSAAYFDASPSAPATVPLLQAWSAIALGRWDDSATNWPWLLMLAALALAIYGVLRERGLAPLAALTVAYLTASLPLLDTHVALAGYADLMLSGSYTLCALALARWASSRDLRDGAVAAGLALGAAFVETSGWLWIATLAPGALLALSPRHGGRIAAWGFGIGALTLLVLSRSTPLFSGLTLHLEYVSPWRSLADAYLLTDNWHLLWYAVPVLAILGLRRWLRPPLAPLALVVAAAIALVLVAAMFGNDLARWFPEARVVNRATVQIAPLVLCLGALLWRELTVPHVVSPTSVPASAPDPGPATDA